MQRLLISLDGPGERRVCKKIRSTFNLGVVQTTPIFLPKILLNAKDYIPNCSSHHAFRLRKKQ